MKYISYFMNKYPRSEFLDYVKIIHQSIYGNGHFFCDEESFHYLEEEAASIPMPLTTNHLFLPTTPFIPLYEYLSDDFARINLAPYLQCGFALEDLFTAMKECSLFTRNNDRKSNQERFFKKVAALKELLQNKNISFDDSFSLDEQYYRHTKRYHRYYSPHYRVVNASFINDKMRELNFLSFLHSLEGKKIVGCDGSCCTGKTYLSNQSNFTVIHADDFFPDKSEINNQPLQYDLLAKAVASISYQSPFNYQAFSCKDNQYYSKHHDRATDIVIVEGAFIFGNSFKDHFDYLILFKAPLQERLLRLSKREDDKLYERFIKEWIPREDRYFTENCFEAVVDIII